MTALTPATSFPWSADVVAFAKEQQVEPYLEPLLEATRRFFPTTRRLEVYVSEDPEIRGDRHIIFDIQILPSNMPQIREGRKQWKEELFRVCPAPLVCTFRLLLDLVSP